MNLLANKIPRKKKIVGVSTFLSTPSIFKWKLEQFKWTDFLYGLRYEFISFYITYAIIKTLVFAFIVSSISSYFGYYAQGGAIAVGKSSTEAL